MSIYRPTGGSIYQELEQVARAMSEPSQMLMLAVSYTAPDKPRDGMIVLADGVNFNPGSGAGFYGYRSGGWQLLG